MKPRISQTTAGLIGFMKGLFFASLFSCPLMIVSNLINPRPNMWLFIAAIAAMGGAGWMGQSILVEKAKSKSLNSKY